MHVITALHFLPLIYVLLLIIKLEIQQEFPQEI